MRQTLLLLGVLASPALSAYVPGTPGSAWTKEEVLAVKAKLWQSFAQRGALIKQARVNILTKKRDTLFWRGYKYLEKKCLLRSFKLPKHNQSSFYKIY